MARKHRTSFEQLTNPYASGKNPSKPPKGFRWLSPTGEDNNAVVALHNWTQLKNNPDRGWFELAQHVFSDPKSYYSHGNPNGLIEADSQLLGQAFKQGPKSPEEAAAWEALFRRLGFYDRFYACCQRKLDAGEFPEFADSSLFPGNPVNIRAQAEHWLAVYNKQPGKRVIAVAPVPPEYPEIDSSLPRVEVSFLPGMEALMKDDVELKNAWHKLKRSMLKTPRVFEVLQGPAESVIALMQKGRLEEAQTALQDLIKVAVLEFENEPWVKEFNYTVALVVKKHQGHPDKLVYPNESTYATLSKLKNFLDTRFPVEGEAKLAAACPGWKDLSSEKQQELIGKNRSLHAAFEKYSQNTETHNALYDATYARLNKGMAPREWSVLAAGLGARILPTLPELYLREVTSRGRNEHSDYVAQNAVDERGQIRPRDGSPVKKRPHAVLFFDFVKSMRAIAPDEPFIDDMRKYDMMMALLRYKREGIAFDTLDAFEAKVIHDGGPLAYMKHAAAAEDGKNIALDGFEGVDPSREAQRKDFAEVQRLLPDLPVALADYAEKSIAFHLGHAQKYQTYVSAIIEPLSTLSRENSTDKGGSYMEAMLLQMQQYLGYQKNEKAKIQALLWPYVHVGESAGVEVDHAADALSGLMHQLSIAKMDATGRYADWLTESIQAMYGEYGFQALHYRHYDLLAHAMSQVHDRADPTTFVAPQPETHPLLTKKAMDNPLSQVAGGGRVLLEARLKSAPDQAVAVAI